MKIILLKDIERLGNKGKVLDVKDGFARNYLLPQGEALPATDENIRMLKLGEEKEKRSKERDKKTAQKLAEEISKVSLTIACQAQDNEELFGSVNVQMIASALKEEGYDIDKESIILPEPIKKLGIYHIRLRLSSDVDAEFKVWIVKK